MTNGSNHSDRLSPLAIGMAIGILGIVLFASLANWWGIPLSVQAADVANLLAPLFLASAFIERTRRKSSSAVARPWI
jgi:hypothetical protein